MTKNTVKPPWIARKATDSKPSQSHLALAGWGFFLFAAIMLLDTYSYFVEDQFYEGFAVFGPVLVFDLLALLLLPAFLVRKDYKWLMVYLAACVLITVFGMLGFNISLIMVPLVSGAAAWLFLMAKPKREVDAPDA